MGHKEIVGAASRRERFSEAAAAHRDGDFSRALQICDSILEESGVGPEVLNLKAVVQAEAGELVMARESILSAIQAADSIDEPKTRAALHLHAARILGELDLFTEALQHARRAFELAPDNPGHAYQRARLALLSGDSDETSWVLARCVQQYPDFEEAHILQCQSAMEQGDLDSAVAILEGIVKQNPGHARAWSGLADMVCAAPDDEPVGPALNAIYAAGPGAQATPGDWATAVLALAAMHRRNGDHDLAFELCQEANRHLQGRANWDMDSWESGVEATLIAAGPFQQTVARDETPQPLLIVGMPRSGSTLLERVLAAHPEVSAGGERSALAHIERYLATQGHQHAAAGLGMAEEVLAPVRSLYRAGMERKPETRWVCDKALRNFERLGLAKVLFPGCKAIWIVRAPTDAILSSYFQDFQHGLAYSHSLRHLARMYLGHWRLMLKWMECFGESIYRVNYRELVGRPEPVIRGLCEFLGLTFTPAMLSPDQQPGGARTASVLQVQRPINTQSLDRWRDFEDELAEEIDFLRRHGVPVDEL